MTVIQTHGLGGQSNEDRHCETLINAIAENSNVVAIMHKIKEYLLYLVLPSSTCLFTAGVEGFCDFT
jgi:hypothetical protein